MDELKQKLVNLAQLLAAAQALSNLLPDQPKPRRRGKVVDLKPECNTKPRGSR